MNPVIFNLSNLNNTKYFQKTNSKCSNSVQAIKYNQVSFRSAKQKPVSLDAIKTLARGLSDIIGNPDNANLVREAGDLMSAGKINEAIAFISQHSLPNGAIKELADKTIILARNWDGTPKEHVFEHVSGFMNLGLYKDVTPAEIFNKAFGRNPNVSVGMVGWTNVKPDHVKGGTSLSKADLTKLYVEAIEEFYKPIDDYLLNIGINPKDRIFISSVSYDGVDKAIMDMGQKMGIDTLTVTPFDYAIYGRNEHPFPTLITDTVPQYANVYSKLSDVILVTGGRDHAHKYDAGNKWLKNADGLVIPVDVLKEYKGIELPGIVNGKIENAAALAYETFSNPLPKDLVEAFKYLPDNSLKQKLTNPAQQALATVMYSRLTKAGKIA